MRGVYTWLLALVLTAVYIPAGAQTIPAAALRYQRPLIANAQFVWGLNAPIAVLAAQVHQESSWRPDAKSAYAAGLAQFTPGTASDIAKKYPDLAGAQVYDPSWALRALARYDYDLYQLEPKAATDCDRWGFTLAAYNGGRGWIIKQKAAAKAKGSSTALWFLVVETYRVRAQWAHDENVAYPRAILLKRQPPYLAWGRGVACAV